MTHPQCQECGRFIPYSRATLAGGLDGFPSPSWEEWWEGCCEKCEDKVTSTVSEKEQT